MKDIAMKTECPYCLTTHSHSGCLNHKSPVMKPGQLAICSTCGKAAVLDEKLSRRAMTDDEWDELPEALKTVLRKARGFCLMNQRNALTGGSR